MTLTPTIPPNYDGREQALIKHTLLSSYLERLLMIIGMGGRRSGEIELCYVDCFAGPWGDATDDLSGTSIAISLETMAQCRRALLGQGINARMRALYIERDRQAFDRLRRYLDGSTPVGVEAQCQCGDFVQLREDILTWCGRRAFTFFFIDPKGWQSVAVPILQPLLQRPGSEFLINFMYDFINRTAAMAEWQAEMARFLECKIEQFDELRGQAPETREATLVQLYRDGLKRNHGVNDGNGMARTAYVRVMDPDKERPKYHLVYLTSHPKGIVKFMEISERVNLVQRRVRAEKRNARREAITGTSDLFGAETYANAASAADQVDPRHVDAFWLQYLGAGTKRVGENEMAEFLESTGWMPGDYQASLVRLIEDGEVRNLDAQKHRPKKPLHCEGDGERLELISKDEA